MSEDNRVAYIVWNEARNEGVIFVEDGTGLAGWPSAHDDAKAASLGPSMNGTSSLAHAFFDAYDDNDERPIQKISVASLARAETAEAEVARLREALEKIAEGYGPNHLSKFASDIARAALAKANKEEGE